MIKVSFCVIALLGSFSPLFASGSDESDQFDWNCPIAMAYDLSEEISPEGLMLSSLEDENEAKTIAYADLREMQPKDKIDLKPDHEETAAYIRMLIQNSNMSSQPDESSY